MKKSIIVLLILAILAGIGLTSCKNEVQVPVDELVSISFGYDSSRALTASLQEFDVGQYHWFYESEKADGSGLKSGQTGAGLTDLSDLSATNVADKMLAVTSNSRPANGNNKGLGEPIQGFSKGLWNFRLMAATVDGNNHIHPVYIGEAHGVLIDNDNHTVNVVVSPLSADYPLDVLGEKGYLEIGEIEFKEASLTDQVSLDDNLWTITDMVSRNNSGTWVEVSHEPIHNETGDFDYFELSAGTYLYTRIYKYNGSEITSGSVIVTIYPNLTTTVSGFVTELTTSFNFETTENPDVVNVSAEATIAYNDTTYTSDTYTLAVDGQDVSKVEAEITKTAADSLIVQLTNAFKQTDTSMADIDLDNTNTTMDLNLGVRTTATTALSVVYDINMTAVVTYDGGSDPDIVKETDVKSVPDYVTVTVDMQSGLSSVSVTHSGYAMKAVADIEAATEYDDEQKGDIWVGFYKYDSTNNKLYIKTKSFSPFVVSYEYATSAPMAKVIRYVYDKTNETVMKSATITSAAKETLDYQTDGTRIAAILKDVADNETYVQDLSYAAFTGTLVTFMPRVNAIGMIANQLPESDYFYSGGYINGNETEDLEPELNSWRAEFKITSDYSFAENELNLVGSYYSLCEPYPLNYAWGKDTNKTSIYVMKDESSPYYGAADYITYDILLGLCGNEDESVRPGFTCGASLGSAAATETLLKTIKVQLILTNDNFQEVMEDPTKRVEVVCAEVVTGFRPATMGDDVTISYAGKDLFTASLQEFALLVNAGYTFEGCTVTLNHDVDLNNEEWTPIGTPAHPFSGVFDGQDYIIENYKIRGEGEKVGLALFGAIEGTSDSFFYTTPLTDFYSTSTFSVNLPSEDVFTCEIKNLNVSGADVNTTADGWTAAVVGYVKNATISNVHVSKSSINATEKVGGIAGALTNNSCCFITNCSTAEDVTISITGSNKNHCAGILSRVLDPGHAIIANCTNNATISCSGVNGSGIAGQSKGTLFYNDANNGAITSGTRAAGIATDCTGSVFINCINTGYIKAAKTMSSNTDSTAGIASYLGSNGNSVIVDCQNSGTVEGTTSNDTAKIAGIVAGGVVSADVVINNANTGMLINLAEGGKVYDICNLSSVPYVIQPTDLNALNTATATDNKYVKVANAITLSAGDTITLNGQEKLEFVYSPSYLTVDLTNSNESSFVLIVDNTTVKLINGVGKKVTVSGKGNSVIVENGQGMGTLRVYNDDSLIASSLDIAGTADQILLNGSGLVNAEVKQGATVGRALFGGTGTFVLTNKGTISHTTTDGNYGVEHTIDTITPCDITIYNFGTIEAKKNESNVCSYALLFYGGATVKFYAYNGSLLNQDSHSVMAISGGTTVAFYYQEGAGLKNSGNDYTYPHVFNYGDSHITVTEIE